MYFRMSNQCSNLYKLNKNLHNNSSLQDAFSLTVKIMDDIECRRFDRYLRMYLPPAILWTSLNDLFGFHLKNKAELFPSPELLILQR
jgi:hypothetical protein